LVCLCPQSSIGKLHSFSVRFLASSQNLKVDALHSASKPYTSPRCCQTLFQYMDYLSLLICSIEKRTGHTRGVWESASSGSYNTHTSSGVSSFCAPIKNSDQSFDADQDLSLMMCYQNAVGFCPCLFLVFASRLNTRNMYRGCFLLLEIGDGRASFSCPPSGWHQKPSLMCCQNH
jgi:hypothetical protein